MEPITGTEMLGQLIGRKMPLNEIRCVVYEGAKLRYNKHGRRPKMVLQKAAERVKELDAELDAQFL